MTWLSRLRRFLFGKSSAELAAEFAEVQAEIRRDAWEMFSRFEREDRQYGLRCCKPAAVRMREFDARMRWPK